MAAVTSQVPLLRWLVPRQRRATEAMVVVNRTLDQLISKCKRLVRSQPRHLPPESPPLPRSKAQYHRRPPWLLPR